jgi:cytidylate kinase
MTRSIEALVDQQARRWQLFRGQRREDAARPVLTVSRQHGAGGGEVARRVAEELGLDFFDREIIQQIAESSHLSERVVSALDEKDRELLTDWLGAISSRNYLSPVEYRYHLSRIVGTVAHHGGAVILGRGAHLILGQGAALRVLLVAPLEPRIQAVMKSEGLSERDARHRIASVEADRKAFLMKHFHADLADLTTFDLVVNTAVLGIEGACGGPREAPVALRRRRQRRLSPSGLEVSTKSTARGGLAFRQADALATTR